MSLRAAELTRRALMTSLTSILLCGLPHQGARAQTDPLPFWNEGAAKKALTDFVARVTTQGGAGLVPPEERIVVFDNDGTLWAEQPVYFQFAFAFDRVKALAQQHPEWRDTQPFKAVIEGDARAFAAAGE